MPTRARYSENRLFVRDIRYFEVRDDFPRIRPGDLPPGVVDITYKIDPSSLAPFEVERVRGGGLAEIMSVSDPVLATYNDIRQQIQLRASVSDDGTLREEVFTRWAIDLLEEKGEVGGGEVLRLTAPACRESQRVLAGPGHGPPDRLREPVFGVGRTARGCRPRTSAASSTAS